MMLTTTDYSIFNQIARKFKHNEHVTKMKQFIQHGRISTYDHGKDVAKMSYWINQKFHLNANLNILIPGAFLHDFFLYDWHDGCHESHSWKHPSTAANNAETLLLVDQEVSDVIRSHMWPINPRIVPKSKEAWIVVVADKICSLRETLFCR